MSTTLYTLAVKIAYANGELLSTIADRFNMSIEEVEYLLDSKLQTVNKYYN